jgi:hypothetical protein
MGDFHSPFSTLMNARPFRAETLGVFGHRLDLALRRAGQPLALSALTTPPLAMAPLKTLNVLARNSSVKSTSSIAKRVSGLSMP